MLETKNDGVKFINSQLRSLSEQFQSLKERYDTTQASIVEEVLSIAGGYAEPLVSLSSLLAKIDVLVRLVCLAAFFLHFHLLWCCYSFAHVSASAPTPYVRPTLSVMGKLATYVTPISSSSPQEKEVLN